MKKLGMLIAILFFLCIVFVGCRANNDNACKESEPSVTETVEETCETIADGQDNTNSKLPAGLGEEELPIVEDEETDVTQSTTEETSQKNADEMEAPTEMVDTTPTENTEGGSYGSGGLWSIGEEEI